MSERSTGATAEQIEAAKAWTANYLDVLISTGRAIAAEALRVSVPPTHRIVAVEDLKRLLEMVSDLPLTDSEPAFIQRISRTLIQTS